MKNKTNILIFVFILLTIIYIIRGLVDNKTSTETLYHTTIEDAISTEGIVIKYEDLYDSPQDGILEARFTDGEKVSKGSLIATIYRGEVSSDVKNRLEQVNRKIAVIEQNYSKNSAFSNDISKLEQEISENLNSIIDSAYKKDMSSVASHKYTVSVLAERKAQAMGNTQAKATTLDLLYEQKADLEAQIGAVQNNIYSKSVGLFSSYIDSLEELITPYNMHELTPSKFKELKDFDDKNLRSDEKSKTDAICKIIDNYRYFVAVTIPQEEAEDLKNGETVRLRFYDLSANKMNAKIFSISEAEDGNVVVIVECKKHQSGLLEKRFVNLEFIKKTYNGFKVSLNSLHTTDGVNGLYVARENIQRFIPVDIVYNKDSLLLVSSHDAQNPLKLYDEIITRAPALEDGKIID